MDKAILGLKFNMTQNPIGAMPKIYEKHDSTATF